jgi:hypothetical protein
MIDPVKKLLGELIAEDGGGWIPAHYVVCLGLERVMADGTLETASWWVVPDEQAEYVTDGLLNTIQLQRDTAGIEGPP